MQVRVAPGDFRRPEEGLRWSPGATSDGLPHSGGIAWQSNGGYGRRHPARALPFTLDVPLPPAEGRLVRVFVAGVFALYADPAHEPLGTVGAVVALRDDRETLVRLNLVQGRHYGDARDLRPVYRLNGDGTSLESIGECAIEDDKVRVDLLTLDVPGGLKPTHLTLRSLGTSASFVVTDVLFEFEEVPVCPFKGHGGRIALGEIGSVLRMHDRARFDRALEQLTDSLREADDLDEARGLALTFLAVVCAAMIEMGAPREVHRVQLDAARALDALTRVDDIARRSVALAHQLTESVLPRSTAGDSLIDRALQLVERRFAQNIQDADVAAELGLSTSHFRFLFREATKQPFHKYVVALRLEKARELLLQGEVPVTQVAEAVGFSSPAHFTRAFHRRFGVSPSTIRRGRR